jgi:integration host factor subunit beta
MAGSKYTKADIVDSMYQKTGMSRKEIRIVLDLCLDEIKDALIKGRIIELRGFGTFEVRIRKGRQKARNPKTGTMVSVHSHGIAAFRPGRELKRDVWNLDNRAAFSDAEGDPLIDDTDDMAGGPAEDLPEVSAGGGAGNRVAGFVAGDGVLTGDFADGRSIGKIDGNDT